MGEEDGIGWDHGGRTCLLSKVWLGEGERPGGLSLIKVLREKLCASGSEPVQNVEVMAPAVLDTC